jgi:di/tricarboxylate transporter
MKLQSAIAVFLVLFGAVEFWEWMKERSLPFPLLLLGGLLLAVSSNYSKLPIESWLVRLLKPLVEDSEGERE